MSSSQAKIKANCVNSQRSTGPTSEAGKAKSSLNAVKTGLTGRTVVLTADDASAYEEHVHRIFEKYDPLTDEERELTQHLADTEWRLLRIPTLEAGIYALGRKELAAQFEGEDPSVAPSMLEAKIFIVYQRQLNNLSIQENRLRRFFEKSEEKLAVLQKPGKQLKSQRLGEATNLYLASSKSGEVFDKEDLGFEFEMDEVLERSAAILARKEGSATPLVRAHKIFRELQGKVRSLVV